MDLKASSTNAVKGLHQAIRNARSADDSHAGPDKPYGVREYPDWRQWSDALEAELVSRGEPFEPMNW